MRDQLRHQSKILAQMLFPKIGAFSRIALHVHGGRIIGLTPQQIKVIMELDEAKSLRLSQLSQSVCVTHGTMNVAVKKLLKKGLLIKTKDPCDERAIRLGLSTKGKSVAVTLREKTADVFKFICQKLSFSERQKLIESYQFLLKTYQNIAEREGI